MRHGIHAHPDDLDALTAHGGLARLRELGFTDVALAVAEGGGRTLLPWHGGVGVRDGDEGDLFFRTRGDFGMLEPRLAERVAFDDGPSPLERFCKDAADCGIEARAWLNPLRNRRLATRYPHACVVNAFGDRERSALCPAQGPVREYLVQLVDELALQPGLQAIEIEGLGFADPRRGAARTECALPTDPYADFLLSICFCSDCSEEMKRAGLGLDWLRSRVRDLILARLGTQDVLAPRRASTNEETFRRLEDDLGHAAMFALWSHRLAVYLRTIKALRKVTQGRVRVALHVHFHSLFSGDAIGAPLQVLQGHADELIASHVDDGVEALRSTWRGESIRGHVVRAAIRPFPPYYRSADDLWTARSAVRDSGGSGVVVHALGTLPWPTLERVAAVLRDGAGEAAAAPVAPARARRG
jgi:hypothetical protein